MKAKLFYPLRVSIFSRGFAPTQIDHENILQWRKNCLSTSLIFAPLFIKKKWKVEKKKGLEVKTPLLNLIRKRPNSE